MTYTLIIADDEPIEREVLAVMIQRELPDVRVVAEAKNGRQAVELGREWRPDLMMLDIKMPGIDGIAAIRELSEVLPDTKFVLVSAYDTFDYAKEAVSLGVKEYLLKPASKEQVVDTIRRLTAEIERERERRREEAALREKVTRLLPEVEKELATLLMIHESGESFQPYLDLLEVGEVNGFAIVATFHPKEQDGEGLLPFNARKQEWYDRLYHKAKELARCFVSPFLWRQVGIFVLSEEAGGRGEYSARVKAIQLARHLCNLFSREPVHVRFGIGNVYSGLEGLNRSYQEAAIAVKDPSAPASIHHYGDLPFAAKTYVYSLEKEARLLEQVRLGKTENSVAMFHHMLDEAVRGSQGEMRYVRRFLLECVAVISRVAYEYRLPLEEYALFSADDVMTVAQAKQAGEWWIRKVAGQIELERSRRMGRVIDQVKQYLQEHFAEDVKLEEVAERFGISPYYLSKLFGQQSGTTFIDYLTDLRIAHAKRLLEDPQKGLKEICCDVGYANPNYFSRVFKKKTGMTPSEYRQERTGQKREEDAKKG